MHLTSNQMATIKKSNIMSVGGDKEKLELLCPIGENTKWCSCYGKEYGDSSKY